MTPSLCQPLMHRTWVKPNRLLIDTGQLLWKGRCLCGFESPWLDSKTDADNEISKHCSSTALI